ncbi:hypothetical protein [Serratia ficaria]|uniref:hypothetical protein n=1 Tax=Serratia ficaria TaxID=61651 RepID=UPI0021843C0C|nr:hypothetical protein [Serratia ficaria]CAI2536923.1 Uncharacterised protein [Serratia ficaria]
MDNELKFSLSYEQLTQEAEEAILKCNLNQDGMGYILEHNRASGILSLWYGLALCGNPDAIGDERVDADWQRLNALIKPKEGGIP